VSTPARHTDRLYVDGAWRAVEETIEVTDLADGGSFTEVGAATPERAAAAIGAATGAEPEMRSASTVERADWLGAIADGIEARADTFAETVVREAGKPIASARSEVEGAAERFRRAVEEARSLDGDYVEGTTPGHEDWKAIVEHEPIGTVLAVAPYNYPLSTTALHVAPALAAGNAVVLKPASQTPVSGALLAEVIADAGLPDGGFNFVPGRGSVIGDALAGDDRVDGIAMTGSTAAGKRVAEAAGMVNLHLELGGNAPALVFPDADLTDAAGQCAAGSFKYAGQRCSAVSRVLVHEAVHDEMVSLLEAEVENWETGDLFDPSTAVGPLIDEAQAGYVAELVDDAVDRGARLVRGGDRDGRLFEPTLLAEVPHDARLLREEQFGPVAVVSRVADEESAVALANDSDLGLDASVFTSDYDRALRVAERIEAGSVRINGRPSHGIGDIPFGGVKESGINREGIGVSLEPFVQRKSIVL